MSNSKARNHILNKKRKLERARKRKNKNKNKRKLRRNANSLTDLTSTFSRASWNRKNSIINVEEVKVLNKLGFDKAAWQSTK